MRRTVFSKIFVNNIIIILVSMLILAVLGYFVISQTIYESSVETLKDNATAISELINSGVPPERLENFLYGFSHSSKKNIIIINRQRKILMEFTADNSYNSKMGIVEERFCEDVLEGKEHIERGNLGGIYNQKMFTLQLPVVTKRGNEVIGAVFISAAAPETTRLGANLARTLSFAMILVITLALVMSFALSRRISKPIKSMGLAMKKFVQGDFSSRVEKSEKGVKISEMEELTTHFNDMAFHLEKAEDIRNNFISDVSHELRTPMTTIGGFVDGILDGTIPPEKHRDYLAIVKEEVLRLSTLVNSFLEVTRTSSGNQPLNLSVFDINEVIRRNLFNFESKIVDKKLSVDVVFENDGCLVKADKDAVTRVVTNLVENAIKFSDLGGCLRISTFTRQHEVFVSVYNTGCGISEEDKKLIFQRFYKVDKSRSENREGTGIGLFIVKDIINRHGKNITVNSVEGEFVEFVFSLDKGKI